MPTEIKINKYKELDDAIKEHIRQNLGIHPIWVTKLLNIAAIELGFDFYRGGNKECKLIEQRIQALREAGQVMYSRQFFRWELVSEQNKNA
ncbi:hypothetical protein [Giesbergeria anulus]|nr:hypothetical protein [Giesbergeria anulus]